MMERGCRPVLMRAKMVESGSSWFVPWSIKSRVRQLFGKLRPAGPAPLFFFHHFRATGKPILPNLHHSYTMTTPKPRILIIEDEALTVAALKHELVELGYEIAGTGDNAPDAMKAAETNRPDLVLMDIHLAGPVSGIVAAIAIRGLLHIPVIFLTAHSDAKT